MIKIGFGSSDITPPLGCVLAGAFFPRISDKIHDPLFANAVVLENAEKRICLVSCDLVGVGREEAKQARELVKEKTGIPQDSIIICATHTHMGPVTRDDSFIPGFEKARDEKWAALLPSYICSAVIQAVNSMKETGVACLSGFEDKISFNRRFLMKDGSIKTNPGVGNPDIAGSAGPVDPEVGVLAFGLDYTEIHGVLVNFALHTDTWSGRKTSISAGFPGVMGRMIKQFWGAGTGFVYTPGAMGDINHIDVKRPEEKKYKDFEFPSRIGAILGAEIIKTASRISEFKTHVELASARAEVKLPLKKYNDSDIAKALQVVSEIKPDLNNSEYMSSVGILRASKLSGEEFTSEITALRIGAAVFVSIPGEYFVELGLYIKEKSPFPHTFVVELGFDSLGYIATEKACKQGAYEPLSSPLETGAGEILADEAIALIRSLA